MSGARDKSSTSKANGGVAGVLPLAEQAKLVYGLVFSLRNMTRKLSPTKSDHQSDAVDPNGAPSSSTETLHSFSTSTYTLAHLQTPTKYTFVMLTDPVLPPTRRAPATGGGTASATFSGGGGIPATGGMTTTGVLQQISRGPWVDFVARNPACLSLQRTEYESDDDLEDRATCEEDIDPVRAAARRTERKQQREKDLIKQRISGLGKSVDSEAFRAAVERVLGQNKLNAPRI